MGWAPAILGHQGEEIVNEVWVVLEFWLLMPSPEVPGEVPGVLWGVQWVDELPSWALPSFPGEQRVGRARLCFPQESGPCAMI